MSEELTEAAISAGAHVLSEWYNDNAPLGEERYREPAIAVFMAIARQMARDTL
jgi:hypothetical protein